MKTEIILKAIIFDMENVIAIERKKEQTPDRISMINAFRFCLELVQKYLDEVSK